MQPIQESNFLDDDQLASMLVSPSINHPSTSNPTSSHNDSEFAIEEGGANDFTQNQSYSISENFEDGLIVNPKERPLAIEPFETDSSIINVVDHTNMEDHEPLIADDSDLLTPNSKQKINPAPSPAARAQSNLVGF